MPKFKTYQTANWRSANWCVYAARWCDKMSSASPDLLSTVKHPLTLSWAFRLPMKVIGLCLAHMVP